MGDRAANKAFNEAMASQNIALDNYEKKQPKKRTQQDEEAEIRSQATPMDIKNAEQRILLAYKDKDYFRLMELVQPDVDELDRPVWPCTPDEVSRAFRRLSLLVHPDKNPSPDARQAFEALKEANRILKDPAQLEEVLKKSVDAARERRQKAEAAANPEERIVLNALKKKKLEELRKKEGADFQAEILRQLKEKQERLKRKRDFSRKKEAKEEEKSEEEEEEGDEVWQRRTASGKARKGKPKLIF